MPHGLERPTVCWQQLYTWCARLRQGVARHVLSASCHAVAWLAASFTQSSNITLATRLHFTNLLDALGKPGSDKQRSHANYRKIFPSCTLSNFAMSTLSSTLSRTSSVGKRRLASSTLVPCPNYLVQSSKQTLCPARVKACNFCSVPASLYTIHNWHLYRSFKLEFYGSFYLYVTSGI